jgi:hypothetical protein
MGGRSICRPNQLPPAPYTVTNLATPDAAAPANVKQMKQQLKDLVAARTAYYADPAKESQQANVRRLVASRRDAAYGARSAASAVYR